MRVRFLCLAIYLLFLFKINGQDCCSNIDSIVGNVKSIREEILFINPKFQLTKFMELDSDYGHGGFNNPKQVREIFNNIWYSQNWTKFINYYKKFNTNKNIDFEIWYDSKNEIERKYSYDYNEKNKIIKEVEYFNSGRFLTTLFIYDGIDNLQSTLKLRNDNKNFYYETFYYDSIKLIGIKKFSETGESIGEKYYYNENGSLKKIFFHSPYFHYEIDSRTSKYEHRMDGIDIIKEERLYDSLGRIKNIKTYNRYKNISILFDSTTFKYDSANRLISNFRIISKKLTGTLRNFSYNENNKLNWELFISSNLKDTIMYREFFYNEFGLVSKIILIHDQMIQTPRSFSIIEFLYTYDKKNNWKTQLKVVDGESRYLRKRKIKYFN